jgi:hypothetical protein
VTEDRPEETGQVTVVLTIRNRSSLLRQTARSTAAQQDVATTIVVFDDASILTAIRLWKLGRGRCG